MMRAKQSVELWYGQDTLSAGQQGQNAQLVQCDIHPLSHAGLATTNSKPDLPSDANITRRTRGLRCFHCNWFKLLYMGKVKDNIHRCLMNNQEVRSEAQLLQLCYLS